ncbi:VOC family protein [Euzebya tangerina]|uniref:VOC family protein n=1 Tax=Euzebya tangerina TaxID=591198 RepID=UPI000E322C29|nr:VOC family protein [Euzebya tangerina]
MSQPTSLSAVTLVVTDMRRSWAFYAALGFEAAYGGPDEPFTSFRVGSSYLNLQVTGEDPETGWGRAIFYVTDVDGMYRRAVEAGMEPEFEPRDAEWGERYFHLRDPDGHELSFAKPL